MHNFDVPQKVSLRDKMSSWDYPFCEPFYVPMTRPEITEIVYALDFVKQVREFAKESGDFAVAHFMKNIEAMLVK